MGAVNVGAVLTTWHALPHRARVVLVAMAHVALDTPRDGQPARRYFGGPGYLAEVLYGPAGVESNDGGEIVATPSAGRQVEKVLTELVRAGAVHRVVTGGRRHRSEYEIVLTPPVSPTETVGHSPTVSVGSARPDRSVQPDRTGRPQENIGTNEEHQEDNHGSGDRLTSRATTSRTRQGWSDVALLDDAPTTALYPAASAYLERTVGTETAGDMVATYLLEHVDASVMTAVVESARSRGWAP